MKRQPDRELLWGVRKGLLLSRVPLVATYTIQLVPIQSFVMCSEACLARIVQVMSRTWTIS